MGEPVKVEVVGQVLPGSVLRMAPVPFGAENWDVVVEAVREAAGHDRFIIVADPALEIMAPLAEDGANDRYGSLSDQEILRCAAFADDAELRQLANEIRRRVEAHG